MDWAIRSHQLNRRFDGGKGVHGLDLEVPAGQVYGFLGRNGAGKTTTIRLLLGLLRADEGTVTLLGKPLDWRRREALAQVGAMVEAPSLYAHLSGHQNLAIACRLRGLPYTEIERTLQQVELSDDAQRRVGTYSLGMRQRLGVALALLGQPPLLILDEPTNGLDPSGVIAMRDLLRRLSSEHGFTIFLCSHLLSEVEQVATQLGMLEAGRLRFQGSIETLRAQFPDALRVRVDDTVTALAVMRGAGQQAQLIDEGCLEIAAPSLPDHAINRLLVEAGHAVSAVGRHRHSLEDMFLSLTADTQEAA
ncbi:ABC transporter ATP-binding protein [Oleiagrimonas sp. C23AA]|uniref:ABC transporter ATP-binding protein n=1 Tax=Oleiagrimonas sp. C23AA TaxID=2719047 RepID=UPI0014228530|nr:ABC transporter ATP-binding protein [Oleiagrimonas sp. C23AA]NII10084.1 ABC transporter ATP-binding protein [Oleiagrimonas sp. C23AA]